MGSQVKEVMLVLAPTMGGSGYTNGEKAAAAGRVLVVDDDTRVLRATAALVRSLGYEVEIAEDGIEAVAKVPLDVDVVMLDLAMPGMDGYDVAAAIRALPEGRDVPIVIVTGEAPHPSQSRAVEVGASAFLRKPAGRIELQVLLASMLKVREGQRALQRQHERLEEVLERRTAALRGAVQDAVKAQRRLYHTHLDTVRRLAVAAEYKDEDPAAHVARIGKYSGLIGRSLGLQPHEVELLELAAPMHDVGKIGIPDRILQKPGPLDEYEWGVMRQHPIIGSRILRGSASELLQAGEVIALTHHERWDGSGYPSGYAGDEIHPWGRICAVADVFDALTTRRPYKKPMSVERAVEVMREQRGIHFDPRMLDAFLNRLDEAREIRAALLESPDP